jgi:hypothetical protein
MKTRGRTALCKSKIRKREKAGGTTAASPIPI